MWWTLLRTLNVGDLKQLLSGEFFRVFPARQIAGAVGELIENFQDTERFEAAVGRRREALQQLGLPVRAVTDRETDGETRPYHGATILTLYFHQLFDEAPTLLDLRRRCFEPADGELVWAPTRLYVEWDDNFIDGVRSMYRGFYQADDEEFERGLERLDLHGLGEVFLAHFGEGDQRSVHFEIDHFHSTFADILDRCDEEDRSLHHNFAALGVYLSCLYDHLEGLGGSFDVRGAFERATGG